MSYELGKAHYIPSMASKSCNAVGKRNLYVPLTADYEVNGRNYIITVTISCYFGTRININNQFVDMVVDGETLPNTTIDGWVSKDEPGKTILTKQIIGHFNADGTPDVKTRTITLYGNMIYFSDVACSTRKSIPFSNEVSLTIGNIEPAYTAPDIPTAALALATDSRLVLNLETTSFGEGGGKYLYAELSKTNFGTVVKTSDVLNTLAGQAFAVNLQRNTRYYIKAIAANNGISSSAVPITGVTLAASEIIKITPINGGAKVDLIIYNGGGYYVPTTKIEVSTDLETWEEKASTTSKTTFSAEIDDLEAGSTYYFRTKTETTAGVYYSNYTSFTAPGDIWGNIISINPSSTSAVVNYTATVNGGGNIDAIFYYRIVGLEEEWVECKTDTIQSGTTKSFTLIGLKPNYFEYEISANFRKGMKEYDCDPVSFFTIPEVTSNDNCESLEYLVQLICQELEEIKRGNITIFMNDDTKRWCQDETDDTPTLASMLSRVNRFMHAVGCILCSMEGFIEVMKDSKANQVFMGKLGWVDIEDEVIDGSLNPVMSDAIHQAIDELIHKVWHYFGAYDYYGRDLADLQAQTGTSGATGIVGNKVYTWSSGSWKNPQTIEPENFGVIHINDGTYAGNGYYWFVDGWNRLDLDDRDIRARLDTLESITPVISYDGEDYKIAIVDSEMTDTEINIAVPTDVTKDTVVLVVDAEPLKKYGGLKFTNAWPEASTVAYTKEVVESISVDIKYSLDNGTTWINWAEDTPITLRARESMCVKGDNPNGVSLDARNYVNFVMTGEISASGNINSLIDDGDGSTITSLPNARCFVSLFKDCPSLTTAPKLPATTLTDYCYYGMFEQCTSLTVAPELPATTLASGCYFGMFKQCTSLTVAPELPATTLTDYCCCNMFAYCASLTVAPELPATTLAHNCYYGMFFDCSSLSISEGSGENLFFNCPSASVVDSALGMFAGTAGPYTGAPHAGYSYYYNNTTGGN